MNLSHDRCAGRVGRGPLALSAAALAAVVGVAGCGSSPVTPGLTVTVTAPGTHRPDSTPPSAVPTVPSSLAGTVTPGKAGVPRGGGLNLAAVNQSDPTSVAVAALRASLTVDTAIDVAPLDAQRRVIPLLDTTLAALALQPVGGNGGSDATWVALGAHHGYTTVVAANTPQEGQPADTPTTAVRSITTKVTSHGAGGWRAAAPAVIWIVTLTHEPGGWRMSTLRDLGAA